MLQSAPNPQQMFQTMINNNPGLKALVDEANATCRGDAKALFYAKARQRGMTDEQINTFVDLLRQEVR